MLQQYVPLPKVIVTVDERVAPVFPSTKTACQIPSQGSSTCPNATVCTKSTVIREKAALRQANSIAMSSRLQNSRWHKKSHLMDMGIPGGYRTLIVLMNSFFYSRQTDILAAWFGSKP